jgi:hypothetical protein
MFKIFVLAPLPLLVSLLAGCTPPASNLSPEISAAVACELFAKREIPGVRSWDFYDATKASVGKDNRGNWVTRVYAERPNGGRVWFACTMDKRTNGDFALLSLNRSY